MLESNSQHTPSSTTDPECIEDVSVLAWRQCLREDVSWVGGPRYIVQLDVPCRDFVSHVVIMCVDMFGLVVAYVIL